ncbi:hypothetical protein F990_02781 [Acinetobacter tjernbergiae DSM 14971 = CIP 107465]|uniref:Uncharacterized protein n=2 Tax=Acinetobacter tjernbergiae TaxID=202955 RepID=V2UI58_9GAMM|nr:hypothetical protein F990_02781 [Acinetobacter tjernbergiae DSM 14971 = CIP 107465]
MIAGCQQSSFEESIANKHLEEATKKIEAFVYTLNDPKADKEDKEDILCLKYPKIYKYEYLQALLRLSKLKLSNVESKEKLMRDLKITTDYYSDKLGIICD